MPDTPVLKDLGLSQRRCIEHWFRLENILAEAKATTKINLVPLTPEMLKDLKDRGIGILDLAAIPCLLNFEITMARIFSRQTLDTFRMLATIVERGLVSTGTVQTPNGDLTVDTKIFGINASLNEANLTALLFHPQVKPLVDYEKLRQECVPALPSPETGERYAGGRGR